MPWPLLSTIVFLPLLGALILLLLPEAARSAVRRVTLLASAAEIVLAGLLWAGYDRTVAGLQFQERLAWIPSFGIQYYLGADGISLALLGLTAVIFFLAVLASASIESRVKEFHVLVLVLETAVMGVFTAQDYVLFYVFWEVVLIPMYFLIAIWGGPRREYAAIKFLIYTMGASLLMLVGILYLYFSTGAQTFSIPDLAAAAHGLSPAVQAWLFLAFFIGFAVKVPVFPFHTWLPDAHVEAPTPISVILAAILLKMGTYGFLRISLPSFPEAVHSFAFGLGVLGVIGILYGAFAALAQDDFKKLVAYSSVSHMGFVILAIAAGTAMTLNASVFVMVSHGIISAMLFLLVGVWYDRLHTREFARLGGFLVSTPVAGTLLVVAGFANLGLPGMSGFIGEFFTLLGTIDVYAGLAWLAAIGFIFIAAFNLVMMQKVLMGPPRYEPGALPDATPRELATLIPLAGLTILLGVWPSLLIDILNAPVLELVAKVGGL